MANPDPSGWVASFEATYPRLFALFRELGWQPGETGPERHTTWFEAADHFAFNPLALNLILELGALSLQTERPDGSRRSFAFAPGPIFDNLRGAATDYDQDVIDLLDADPFPVGEGNGAVLFVSGSGRSLLLDQSLCGYLRAPDPFALLHEVLLSETVDTVEHRAVAQGERVTGRPW